MKRTYFVAIIALVTLAAPASVLAQENKNNGWGGRGFVTFNVGVQSASQTFAYDFTTTLFDQTAKAGLDTPGKTALSFEVAAGVRVVKNLGFGVTYSKYSNERTATLTTTIPDPLVMYGIPGNASTTSQQMPLHREENAVHIQALYRIPLGRRLQVGAFGGPSYFRCVDDHVTQFGLEARISPDWQWSVAFQDVAQSIDRGSAWGYHAGGSVTYLAAKHVGLDLTVRYSQASHTTVNHFSDTTKLEDYGIWGGNNGTTSLTMKHGGVQWNGGVSFHF